MSTLTDSIKNTIVDLVVEQLLKELVKKAPVLAWGPFNVVVEYILRKILFKAVDAGLLELSVGMMRYNVNREVNRITDIAQQMKRADEKRQGELEVELRSAYRDLIKLN